ncbi:MAG: 6-hydroxymethylpterin diphosphokinase MptE-like protein [Treponema sp.]
MQKIQLHSKYNPHKEAEQFAGTIIGEPPVIVVTEPGESYLAAALREKHPNTQLIAVRYSDTLFTESDALWDAVWRPALGSLAFFLVRCIPDEHLSSARFIAWKAADRVFPEQAAAVWKELHRGIEILKSVMCTRAAFGKRWLSNTIKNFLSIQNAAAPCFGDADFILAGAGPGLYRLQAETIDRFSVAAAASAYRALHYRRIQPHICISTDAGYWAQRHFDTVPEEVPVAFPLEAAVPFQIRERNQCVMLTYNSPLEQQLFSLAGVAGAAASENGTVTGTAVDFLAAHTQSRIVLAGVDLSCSRGFAHAQPHTSTLQSAGVITRLQPLAGILAAQNRQTAALETYRHWFLQLPQVTAKRLYRIGGGAALPNIQQLDTLAEMPRGGSVVFSVKPAHIFTQAVRKQRLLLFLSERLPKITQAIASNSAQLFNMRCAAQTVEKQLCLLAAYSSYIQLMKNPESSALRQKLADEVDTVFQKIMRGLAAV